MKPILVTAASAAFLLAAGAAWADFATADADGDGMLSTDEVTAAYPDVAPETVASVDADGDGMISEIEFTAAVEAGLMPAE